MPARNGSARSIATTSVGCGRSLRFATTVASLHRASNRVRFTYRTSARANLTHANHWQRERRAKCPADFLLRHDLLVVFGEKTPIEASIGIGPRDTGIQQRAVRPTKAYADPVGIVRLAPAPLQSPGRDVAAWPGCSAANSGCFLSCDHSFPVRHACLLDPAVRRNAECGMRNADAASTPIQVQYYGEYP